MIEPAATPGGGAGRPGPVAIPSSDALIYLSNARAGAFGTGIRADGEGSGILGPGFDWACGGVKVKWCVSRETERVRAILRGRWVWRTDFGGVGWWFWGEIW
jgi:hypothetical protein